MVWVEYRQESFVYECAMSSESWLDSLCGLQLCRLALRSLKMLQRQRQARLINGCARRSRRGTTAGRMAVESAGPRSFPKSSRNHSENLGAYLIKGAVKENLDDYKFTDAIQTSTNWSVNITPLCLHIPDEGIEVISLCSRSTLACLKGATTNHHCKI